MLFGRLVREKRGIEGLSQDGLAEKSGLTKARISDIETGKIANPQARTVDALCVALNISREERAACHATSVPSLPPRLLEKLARHFGRDMPDATEEELEAFLMTKAEEFREMRERLKKLAETEDRISELINAANAALGEGDFGTADDLLKEAEAVQLQSSTIVALKKQAQLRIERGNAALMNGDVAAAAGHFERSSRFFRASTPRWRRTIGTTVPRCSATTDTDTKVTKRSMRPELLCSRTSATGRRRSTQRSGVRRRTPSAA